MSTGGSSNVLKAAANPVPVTATTAVTSANSSGASANGTASATLSLTPRFTNEEKEILYSLFHTHEDVIDIKHRKKQKGKYSMREAWQHILDGFNGHQSVTTKRSLKQIQKFWLNARLRKQYPTSLSPGGTGKTTIRRTSSTASVSGSTGHDAVITVPAPIKCEPEYALAGSDTPDTTHNATDEYEEIELHGTTVADPLTVDSMDDSTEAQQNHQQIQQQINQQQVQHQHQHQHQQQQQSTIQAQQISVDQISAEKLTLNDLLHFKNTRPRDEIILQIKHPDGGSITLPSPTRITIPHHQQTTYNQIIGEIKTQPQTQHIQLQQYQTQQIQQQSPQQVQPQQQIQQQYNASNSSYCTYTTQHLPQVSTPSNVAQANNSGSTTSYMVTESSFEERINYFKLKEAELRYKEVQLQLEQKRIDLSRMQEELKHQKEMHRLQVDEMRIKIRILSEEEKRLRNKES